MLLHLAWALWPLRGKGHHCCGAATLRAGTLVCCPSRMHHGMVLLVHMPSNMRGRTRAAAGAGWLGGHRELLEADQGSQLSTKGL